MIDLVRDVFHIYLSIRKFKELTLPIVEKLSNLE